MYIEVSAIAVLVDALTMANVGAVAKRPQLPDCTYKERLQGIPSMSDWRRLYAGRYPMFFWVSAREQIHQMGVTFMLRCCKLV